VPDWRTLLQGGLSGGEPEAFQKHERTGRPLGSDGFVERLEEMLGRSLKKKKPGPKKGTR